jgi:hypothetical protein
MLTVYYIWKLLYMFGWYLHPSSGVHTTVSTAPGIYMPPETCRAVSRYNKMCNVASFWIYIGIDFKRHTDK